MNKFLSISISIAVILIGISVSYYFIIFLPRENAGGSGEIIWSPNDTQLFALKQNCSEEANKFANERSTTTSSMVDEWKLLRSSWNTKKQSCFGEFDSHVSIDTEKWFYEYYIYDVLGGEKIAGYTWLDSGSLGGPEWDSQYLSKKIPVYEEKSIEIFGSVYTQ